MWRDLGLDEDSFAERVRKDPQVMITNFDAAHKLLNCGEVPLEPRFPKFRNKLDLFFIDYEMIPLLIQDSYLGSFQDRKSLDDLETMAEAADMISLGDQMSTRIRRDQNWSLLPNFGTFSSVAPCLLIKGRSLYPAFPQWLGKNSSHRKAKRLVREIKQALGHRVCAPSPAI